MLQVPQFDFTTFNFVAALEPNSATGYEWEWTGPSQPLQHIALAVMGLGQILPITPPTPNASWVLDFWGPALQCNYVAVTERDRIWTTIWNSYNRTTIGSYAFLSWVPWSYSEDWLINLTVNGTNRDLPFFFNVPGLTGLIGSVGPPPSTVSTNGSASLFIAVLPETRYFETRSDGSDRWATFQHDDVAQMCPLHLVQKLTDQVTPDCKVGNTTLTPALVFKDSTLLRCDLVNTSYSVEFSYLNGAQDIRISSNMTGNSSIVNGNNWFTGAQAPAFMQEISSEPANCSSFLADPYREDKGTPCVFDIDAVRSLSYQGIMAAFNQLVLGAIYRQGDFVRMNTTVMKTVLAETKELAFIRDWNFSPTTDGDLQTLISSSSEGAYQGLVNLKLPDARADLKSTLEQLFQNFTISLLAEPYLQ